MTIHQIAGQLTIEFKGLGGVRQRLEMGNVANGRRAQDYVSSFWDYNYWQWQFCPPLQFKLPPTFPTPNAYTGWGHMGRWTEAPAYAFNTGGFIVTDRRDEARMRYYNTPMSQSSGDIPRVWSGFLGTTVWDGGGRQAFDSTGISATDIPTTQIGIPYAHPIYTYTASVLTITSGSPWVYVSGGWGAGRGMFWHRPGVMDCYYITSGTYRGLYWVRQAYDNQSSSFYLMLVNLDGTLFNPTTTESATGIASGPNRSFFNQVGVIPNGTGTAAFDGVFDPGINRQSYILRIYPHKSGSPNPVDSNQKGTYWFSIRPYHSRTGDIGNPTDGNNEDGGLAPNLRCWFPGSLFSSWANVTVAEEPYRGQCNGVAFDEVTQRMWMTLDKRGNGTSLGFWLYKSPEPYIELACTHALNGFNKQLLSTPITLATGNMSFNLDIGSDGTVYIPVWRGTALATTGKLISIKRDFTAAQWTTVENLPSGEIAYVVVDKSRYRSGSDLDTTVGTNELYDNSGSMTAYDVGRAIKITTGADAGTYLIEEVTTANDFTVTTLAGGAVTFAGDAGKAWSIGDRIYLFFIDSVTNDGHIHYMESLAPGTFLQMTVAGLTRGRDPTAWHIYGETQRVCVDQRSGCLYWISNEVSGSTATWSSSTASVYKLDPSTGTLQYRTGTDLQTPGGTPVNTPPAPARFYSIAINPHEAFPELWVGSDRGHIKIPLSDFMTADFYRYYSFDAEASPYQNPAGYTRSCGMQSCISANGRASRQFMFAPDGHVHCRIIGGDWSGWHADWEIYSRQSDNWHHNSYNAYMWGDRRDEYGGMTQWCMDPYGLAWGPLASSDNPRISVLTYPCEIQYQWIGGAWKAQEVVKGGLPDSVTTPGCSAKDMHTSFQNLIMGVRVKFTAQGGGTPANNEFLGVAGVTGAARADGSLSTGSNVITGSSFSVGDVNRYLRIESGSQQGTYKVTAFNDTSHVQLSHPDGTPWTSSGDESSLTYSVWDVGVPESNAGVEVWSVLLADGIGKDNTQDVNYIQYEMYGCKTLLSENAEGTKFCIPALLGPKGSAGIKFYWKYYPHANPNYDAAASSILGLNGISEFATSPHPFDGLVDRAVTACQTENWYGTTASRVCGMAPVLDLGKDIEVGYVVIKGLHNDCIPGYGNDRPAECPLTWPAETGYSGVRATLYNYPDGSAPSTDNTSPARQRCSGVSNLTLVADNALINLTSGSFLGTMDVGIGTPTDGVTAQNLNTFVSSAGRFSQSHVGQLLQVVSGAHANDIGYYRILTVSGDGSTLTIRHMDQTTKAWTTTATGITFQVWDAVREEDVIFYPNASSPTGYLTVERITSAAAGPVQQIQVRTAPATSLSTQSWVCVKSLWNKVKRLSAQPLCTPPEVANNGTWITAAGKDNSYRRGTWMMYFDLTDMTVAQRTARWWKLGAIPKGNNASQDGWDTRTTFDCIEIYDPSGNRIGTHPYQRVDTVTSQPNFFMAAVSLVDILVGSNSGYPAAGFNGLCNLADDVVTLGANAFGTFMVRPGVVGAFDTGTSVFNDASAPFVSSDVGRWLHITSGSQNGTFLRITAKNSASQVAVANIDGTAFAWSSTESSITYLIHEGINAGVSIYDYIWIEGYGEAPILSVANGLMTMTLGVRTTKTLSGKQWEIRRKALPVLAVPTPDPTQSARLIAYEYDMLYAPQQTGDIHADSKGYLSFWSEDCGNGMIRGGGNPQTGTDHFTSSSGFTFFQDDVGRILHLYNAGTVNIGPYRIASWVSSTEITVVNMDGTAVSFTAGDSSILYKIWGERRFKISRYVTGLKA